VVVDGQDGDREEREGVDKIAGPGGRRRRGRGARRSDGVHGAPNGESEGYLTRVSGPTVTRSSFETRPVEYAVPGRPQHAYSSADGDGALGVGFSITGLSAITRCPSSLAQDAEIREVRYDAAISFASMGGG
jgi:hypothetical protein